MSVWRAVRQPKIFANYGSIWIDFFSTKPLLEYRLLTGSISRINKPDYNWNPNNHIHTHNVFTSWIGSYDKTKTELLVRSERTLETWNWTQDLIDTIELLILLIIINSYFEWPFNGFNNTFRLIYNNKFII